jgi:hypothetical protein
MDVKHSSGGRKTPLAHRIPQCGPNGVNRLRGLLAPFLYLKTLRKIMKYDFDKVSKQQFVDYFKGRYSHEDAEGCFCPFKRSILKTAEVKLRTRAEVDADIAKVIREYYKDFGAGRHTTYQNLETYGFPEKLNRLMEEETQG